MWGQKCCGLAGVVGFGLLVLALGLQWGLAWFLASGCGCLWRKGMWQGGCEHWGLIWCLVVAVAGCWLCPHLCLAPFALALSFALSVNPVWLGNKHGPLVYRSLFGEFSTV